MISGSDFEPAVQPGKIYNTVHGKQLLTDCIRKNNS